MPTSSISRNLLPPDAPAATEGRIRSLDFANPDRLSRAVLRALQAIYDEAARDTCQQLVRKGLTSPILELLEIRSIRADALIGELPRPTVIEILSVAPFQGFGVLQLDLSLSFTLINLLMGGRRQAQALTRGLSEVEHSVLSELTGMMLDCFARAWGSAPAAAGRAVAISVAGTASFLDPVHFRHPQETLLLAHFRLDSPDASGDIRFLVPAEAADQLSSLESHAWVRVTPSQGAGAGGALVGRTRILEKVGVRLRAQLQVLDLSLGQLGELGPGDVVLLRPAEDDSVWLVSGDRYRLRGRLVRHGQRLAVQLTGPGPEKERI